MESKLRQHCQILLKQLQVSQQLLNNEVNLNESSGESDLQTISFSGTADSTLQKPAHARNKLLSITKTAKVAVSDPRKSHVGNKENIYTVDGKDAVDGEDIVLRSSEVNDWKALSNSGEFQSGRHAKRDRGINDYEDDVISSSWQPATPDTQRRRNLIDRHINVPTRLDAKELRDLRKERILNFSYSHGGGGGDDDDSFSEEHPESNQQKEFKSGGELNREPAGVIAMATVEKSGTEGVSAEGRSEKEKVNMDGRSEKLGVNVSRTFDNTEVNKASRYENLRVNMAEKSKKTADDMAGKIESRGINMAGNSPERRVNKAGNSPGRRVHKPGNSPERRVNKAGKSPEQRDNNSGRSEKQRNLIAGQEENSEVKDNLDSYKIQLEDDGNNRKHNSFVRDTTIKPKSLLNSTSYSLHNLSSTGKNSSSLKFNTSRNTQDSLPDQRLLGYDWIAALLDNDSAMIDQSESFFNELREFRRAYKDECSNRFYMEGPHTLVDLEPEVVAKILKEPHVEPYVVNERLFPEPMYNGLIDCEGEDSKRSQRQPTAANPRFVRVSIPRSTLQSPQRWKPHRRRSFDSLDSCALKDHCLLGWENRVPTMLPAARHMDLNSATGAGNGCQKITVAEAEKQAYTHSYSHWPFEETNPRLELLSLWKKHYESAADALSNAAGNIVPAGTSSSSSCRPVKRTTDKLLDSTYATMYQMQRLKEQRKLQDMERRRRRQQKL